MRQQRCDHDFFQCCGSARLGKDLINDIDSLCQILMPAKPPSGENLIPECLGRQSEVSHRRGPVPLLDCPMIKAFNREDLF